MLRCWESKTHFTGFVRYEGSQLQTDDQDRPGSMAWTPKVAPLMTKWSSEVDPDGPHPEYPRPQLVREDWTSLNGLWDFDLIEE